MTRAKEGASKLEPIHRQNIGDMLDRAWSNLQAGENHAYALADLCFAANVAGELSELGICSDYASERKIANAQDVLIEFASHHADWSRLVVSDEAAEVMREFLFIAKVQLEFVSLAEFEKARKRVNVAMEAARRGVIGRKTTVIKLTEKTA